MSKKHSEDKRPMEYVIDLKQLSYFTHVAELGSYTRAAEFTNVAQPVLSRQIRKLEIDLRQNLLIRHGRGVMLTDAGKILLKHSRLILRQLEQAQRRFEVGLVTITDVYEAQARYDRAIANEIIAVNERADAQEALRQLTGQAIPSVFFLSQDLPLVTAEPHDVEVWVEEARRNNPTVLAARATVDAAGEEIELTYRDNMGGTESATAKIS